ncbi:hypothetical protein NPS74_22385, partial [Cutibacterium acnes subsp. acnes]|nr:hypothetical protein [Cutibacterium acnes subsp. acnes]
MLADLDVVHGGDLPQRLNGLLGDEPGGPPLELAVVVAEDVDGLGRDAGVAHLGQGCGQAVLA